MWSAYIFEGKISKHLFLQIVFIYVRHIETFSQIYGLSKLVKLKQRRLCPLRSYLSLNEKPQKPCARYYFWTVGSGNLHFFIIFRWVVPCLSHNNQKGFITLSMSSPPWSWLLITIFLKAYNFRLDIIETRDHLYCDPWWVTLTWDQYQNNVLIFYLSLCPLLLINYIT